MPANPMPNAAQPLVREKGIITTPWQRWFQALVADRGNAIVWSDVASGIGYLNGWADLNTAFPAEYGTDGNGQVYLRGAVSGGTVGLPAFTLPTDFAPTALRIFPVYSNAAFGAITVDSSGNVTPSTGSGPFGVFLDGIVYSTN